jgi:subtilisin family serine protease
MRKMCAGVILLLLLSAYSVHAPASERVIIVFHNTPDVTMVSQYGHVHQVFHVIPAVVASLPEPAIQALSRNSHVKYIHSDSYQQFVEAPPVQPEPRRQIIPWNIKRIDAHRAWNYSTGEGVKVALIDTGIDVDHPDLQANIKGGVNTIAPSPQYPDPDDFDDDHGHGTLCAGIVGAVDNNIGVVGVAPDCWLYGVKALNSGGAGYYSDIIEGIEWCIDKKIQVINMSFGSLSYVPALEEACDAAWDAGLILVSCEGSTGMISYPACYSSVMAVAMTYRDDSQPYLYGDELELTAPGEDILTTSLGGGYATMSGGSFCCPHVAGVAALVLSIHPLYSNEIVREILWITAEDLGAPGWDPYYGYGLVDAKEAVLA